MFIKGWETWKQIVKRFGSDPRYQFFHFATTTTDALPLTLVPVNVSSENRHAMVDALRTYDIDVAFLWSLCRETFSFTLHEAMTAGCYIVTNPDSGNIQDSIRRTNRGVVLANDEEAAAWFESDRLTRAAREFRNGDARSGSLVFTPGGCGIFLQDHAEACK